MEDKKEFMEHAAREMVCCYLNNNLSNLALDIAGDLIVRTILITHDLQDRHSPRQYDSDNIPADVEVFQLRPCSTTKNILFSRVRDEHGYESFFTSDEYHKLEDTILTALKDQAVIPGSLRLAITRSNYSLIITPFIAVTNEELK